MLKVSFIGFRRHASLLRNIFEKKNNIKIHKIFTKTKINTSKYFFCDNIKSLLDSDIIVISSPTDFHFEQIKELQDFNGYIFCEKPIVGTLEEIKKLKSLKKLSRNKFYTNFNFRFNKISQVINYINSNKKFGKILKLNINISHSSALKKKWVNEWRLKTKSKLGPLETTGIHYVDFINEIFNKYKILNLFLFSQTKRGNKEVDTSELYLQSQKTILNLRFSYCEATRNTMEVIFDNGYAEYNGQKFNLYCPKNNFDGKGYSIPPKLYKSYKINFEQEWKKSIENSINYFLYNVKNKKTFTNFYKDLDVMKEILSYKKLV